METHCVRCKEKKYEKNCRVQRTKQKTLKHC